MQRALCWVEFCRSTKMTQSLHSRNFLLSADWMIALWVGLLSRTQPTCVQSLVSHMISEHHQVFLSADPEINPEHWWVWTPPQKKFSFKQGLRQIRNSCRIDTEHCMRKTGTGAYFLNKTYLGRSEGSKRKGTHIEEIRLL